MTDAYDVIVIGAGPAGENVADRVVKAGLSAAIIERELVGGECSYWACMPSKALLRPGEALRAVKRVPGAREAVTGELDVKAVLDRRDAMISDMDDKGQVEWLDSANIALIRGHGRIDNKKRVTVTHQDGSITNLEARIAVVIATGSAAAIPPLEGLREIQPWDNRDITTLKSPPESLVIVGGGVVGVEMAQAWKDLGVKQVTILEMSEHLLMREEPFAGEAVGKAFAEYGIKVVAGSPCIRIEKNEQGKVIATCDNGMAAVADEVLAATGRRPLTNDIGLENVGLEPGKFIGVDDQMRVHGIDGGWLWAVGDANGRSLVTHDGKYQARIAGDVIAGISDEVAYGDLIASPRVIFTDPQVAAVGLTEKIAKEKGLNVRSVDYGYGWTAGASTTGEGIEGTVRIVVNEDKQTIVGATFVGPGAGELIHAATIAIVGEVTIQQLWHATPAFPTISEFWLRLLEAYGL